MMIDEIRRCLREQPFRPFRLRLNDGRFVHVGHPDFIAMSALDDRASMITVYEKRFMHDILANDIVTVELE